MEFTRMLKGILFPPVCPLCDKAVSIEGEGRLCRKCEGKVSPFDGPACLKCGKLLPDDEAAYCGNCRKNSFHFRRGYITFLYEDEVRDMLVRFKYKNRKDLALYFARESLAKFGDILKNSGFDAVVPIPIHKKRMKKRGYNQAAEFGKLLARGLGVPCLYELLKRTKQTAAQKELSATARLMNLMDAFEVDESELSYAKKAGIKKLLLVDDIFTTGSTLECAGIKLTRCGFSEPDCLCISGTRGF